MARPTGYDLDCSNITLVSIQKVDCRQQESTDECDQPKDGYVRFNAMKMDNPAIQHGMAQVLKALTQVSS